MMETQIEVRGVTRGVAASDGAGVRLRRYIGQPSLDSIDPFLMLDHFNSSSPDDYMAGFPDHPHRGFETVTYMLAGRVRHRDSEGHEDVIGPGDLQWMTAGRGVIHSEMPEQEEGRMSGLQLWVNLPAKKKMTAPKYRAIPREEVPEEVLESGGRLKVIAGRSDGGTVGPLRLEEREPLFIDIALPKGARVSQGVGEGLRGFLFGIQGEVSVGSAGRRVGAEELGVLTGGSRIEIEGTSDEEARVLLVMATPIGEAVVKWGPFVMNTRREIMKAIEDYQSGRLTQGDE